MALTCHCLLYHSDILSVTKLKIVYSICRKFVGLENPQIQHYTNYGVPDYIFPKMDKCDCISSGFSCVYIRMHTNTGTNKEFI